jgi:hypothetical protein
MKLKNHPLVLRSSWAPLGALVVSLAAACTSAQDLGDRALDGGGRQGSDGGTPRASDGGLLIVDASNTNDAIATQGRAELEILAARKSPSIYGGRTPADSGGIWLILDVRLRNVAAESLALTAEDLTVDTSLATRVAAGGYTTVDKCRRDLVLTPGGSATCTVMFMLPAGAQALLLRYQYGAELASAPIPEPRAAGADTYVCRIWHVETDSECRACMASKCPKLQDRLVDQCSPAWQCIREQASYRTPRGLPCSLASCGSVVSDCRDLIDDSVSCLTSSCNQECR